MRSRVVEWIKSILIVVLLCTAVLLALMATNDGMLPDVSSLFDRGMRAAESQQTVRVQAAAKPVQFSVRTEAGRASVLYDAQELDRLYELFGGMLGQALETADTAQRSSIEALQQALCMPGIYLAYPGAVPLGALAQWLDADCAAAGQAQWFALSIEQEAVRLFFGDGETVMVSKTVLQADRLSKELEAFRPDGTSFAFEREDMRLLSPLTLIDPALAAVQQAERRTVAGEEFTTDTASLLGFNPFGDSYYTEADGTVVFREVGCTLRIAPDGTVQVSNTNTDDEHLRATDTSTAAAIEAARALLQELAGAHITDAALYLSGVTELDGAVRMTFDYYLNGIPVRILNHAAVITVRGSLITELTARVRAYVLLPAQTTLLPAKQAQALAAEGGALAVAYADSGADSLSAGWVS